MKKLVSRRGSIVAGSAAVMSVVWAVFGPQGFPWFSLAWAALACLAVVWVAGSSIRPNRRITDIIRDAG